MDEVFYFLHFTGHDGIRDLTAIGESTKPIFVEFDTGHSQYSPGNRTEIKMNRTFVATFDWHVGDKLGLATIAGRQMLMSHLVYNLNTNNRMFVSADGTRYEWRRLYPEDPTAYDLYMVPHTPIARFRREYEETPVGPSYAYLQFCFDNDLLLLEAMLALCVNRWMDM
ncbi:hypothetical protein PILCRDRAFT_9233 [Piloderma croceum F 1598]|uniref:DUF6593 domain-containing protein n=1 Tax=Piloderma croceum (strain F 1598) TaxID=765440 RepID=A0A0C3B3M8_PILCF|nr:hypothetical protein PILCRDRAFT_9233 [Piloderma croceum F 1598]